MSANRLFQPLRLGHTDLQHRMIMAPLTRFRANDDHVPGPYAKEYYSQRASVPGTFIITEATFISPRASGYNNIPGIWTDAQIEAWKEIVDAVHAKGSFIFLQIWALGRVALKEPLKELNFDVVSPSAVPVDEAHEVPREMTEEDIQITIQDFANAAKNAMKAGFDGVELHGANGYLIDQFWQDVVNHRTDKYGGSVEKRARFGIEVTRAVIAALDGDSKKVGMRLSPYSTFQGMKMEDPIPQFSHIVSELKKLDLAYLHLIESRISGASADGVYHDVNRENDKLVEIWGTESPILLAGGMTPKKATKVVNESYTADNVAIVFGRYFVSTPDLPFRIQNGIDLNAWDRSTFYKPKALEGYVDYPFSKEWLGQEIRV